MGKKSKAAKAKAKAGAEDGSSGYGDKGTGGGAMVTSGSKKAQAEDWKDYGSDAHGVLGAYNEGGDGMVEGTMVQVAMDGDDYSSLLVQNYLAVEGQLVA